ncbi:hypothetical protein H632_c38p4, partial [Helicosporidium sp. ATCC 50920]
MRIALALFFLAACVAAEADPAHAAQHLADSGDELEVDSATAAALSKAHELYDAAVALRDRPRGSGRDAKRAFQLLFAAAGIERIDVRGPPPPEQGTSDDVEVVFAPEARPLREALKELIFMYREGDGTAVNPGVAHALLLTLASMGDPEAQADAAAYLALGVEPLLPPGRRRSAKEGAEEEGKEEGSGGGAAGEEGEERVEADVE